MSPRLVDDELWELIAPLLPRCPRRYRYPGRRRLDDRKVLNGILFVLTTGIAWQRLPQELGYGSGMTCWRRLKEWHRQVCSRHCTSACLPSFAPPGALTSPGLSAAPFHGFTAFFTELTRRSSTVFVLFRREGHPDDSRHPDSSAPLPLAEAHRRWGGGRHEH